ncbi:hypothetical protein QUQ58_002017 [Escherichia coli]|nr:hypothetical protein [Escherichia coli]
MTRGLIVLGVLVAIWATVDSLVTLRREVNSLTVANKILSEQLESTRKQHNVETAVSLLGITAGQHESVAQEKTRVEIRKEIINTPCAGQSVPVNSAQRLWQLATETRDATLPDSARKPDRVTTTAIARQ